MKYIHQIKSVIFLAVMGLLTLTGCEGGDLYNVDAPDWISQKIDSINKSKQNTGEEVLVGMQEDVYSIGQKTSPRAFGSSSQSIMLYPKIRSGTLCLI